MSERVDRIVGALIEGAAITQDTLALELQTLLVARTPVDTGHAASRWSVSRSAPAPTLGISVRVGHGSRGRVSSSLLSQRRVRVGTSSPRFRGVRAARGAVGARLEPVFVSNDAPYIGRLNDGWSQQAPRGFVQQAIADALIVADIKLGNLDNLVR